MGERSGREVALVHDYLLVMRGAERTFAAIADSFPRAPIFTTVYSETGTGGRFAAHQVHTSPLQGFAPSQRSFRKLLPFYRWAVGGLGTDAFPILVSSSSAFAIGAPTAPGAVHVCYCHTPFRYAWYERERALREVARPLRPLLVRLLESHRAWERQAAASVSVFVANSHVTQQRIGDAFGREAHLVYPPVDIDRFRPGTPGESFLVVSELVGHKRVELALQAARRAGASVRVVGSGPELRRLRAEFTDVAAFIGRLSDFELAKEYASARALVMTAHEEFGIAAVEAQASGRPVLAFDVGGARETVVTGKTGERVPDGDVDALAEAMREIDFEGFDPTVLLENAQRFSTERFRERMETLIESAAALPSHQSSRSDR